MALATTPGPTTGAAFDTVQSSSAGKPPRMRTRPLSRDLGGDPRSAKLAESMVAHQRAISTHHHAMLADIAEFTSTEAFRGDGALSMEAWLADRCHVSAAQARTLVAAAQKMGGLPRLSDALLEGRLTLDVLAPLAAVATPESDAELAEASVHWTVRQAKDLATAARGTTDAQAARKFEGRYIRFDDARCTLWAQLTQDSYAIVKSTLVARSTRHDHPSASAPDYEPFERRLADSLVEICVERGRKDGGTKDGSRKRAAAQGAGRRPVAPASALNKDSTPESRHDSAPESRHDSTPESRHDSAAGADSYSDFGAGRPLFGGSPAHIVVHADLDLLTKGDGFGEASIEGLGPISAEIARRLSCDATHTISLDAADGTILDQFPWRRYPTTAQRIEVARRDRGCRWPGCGYNLITNVHHIRHWINGGPTVLANLITLCAAHHSRVHELGWKVSGDGNGLVTFTGPHGRQSTSSPSPSWRRSLPQRK